MEIKTIEKIMEIKTINIRIFLKVVPAHFINNLVK